MALQIAAQAYMFKCETRPPKELEALTCQDLEELDGLTISETIQSPPFCYNPLHDIESIWWITNFFLFHLFTIDSHDRQRLARDACVLFPSNHLSGSRTPVFTGGNNYTMMTTHLPSDLQQHGERMDVCHSLLIHHYKRVEAQPNITDSAFNPRLHNTFKQVFARLRDHSGSGKAYIAQISSGCKRAISEAERGDTITHKFQKKKRKGRNSRS